MFTIDFKSRVPIYEQLKKSALELMNFGVLKADDPMPSVRSLAKQLGVNPNTIQKAYQDMERDGLIYSLAGRGSFVSGNYNNKAKQDEVLTKLAQIAYENKLNGIDLEQAIMVVKNAYERGLNNES